MLAREACDFELLDAHATPADQPDDGFYDGDQSCGWLVFHQPFRTGIVIYLYQEIIAMRIRTILVSPQIVAI